MYDVWPALFVADESRAEEALEALRAGTVVAPLASGGHVRRGARFLLVLENGRVLGSGEVIKVTNDTHELAVWKQAEAPAKAPFLGGQALVRLKAILRHESRPPLQVYILPNEGSRRRFGTADFDGASALLDQPASQVVEKAAPNRNSSTIKKAEADKKAASPAPKPIEPSRSKEDEEFLTWLPPRLAQLVAERVPAAEWETLVSAALCAVGFSTDELGQRRPGEPVPDCVARLEGDTVIKLVVDAKAGTWNAPTEAIRAMKDYVREFGGPRAYAVFVVGKLGPDVRDRLAGAMVGYRDAVAITGRQLAELIVKRLKQPELMMEAEVTRLLRGGGTRR
jgi:hypothetical protein